VRLKDIGGELATISALIVAVSLAVVSFVRFQAAEARLETVSASLSRLEIHDRLIGESLDIGRLMKRPLRAPVGGRLVIWIVDLDHCGGCLGDIGGWKRLESLSGVELAVLYVADGGVQDLGSPFRALQGTVVERVTRRSVSSVLGPLLPSTKLLLDQNGTILLADSRRSNSCNWSFDALVEALLGEGSPVIIRAPSQT
jgi:hypothetical protein